MTSGLFPFTRRPSRWRASADDRKECEYIKPRIITFSGQARHGKDTAAGMLKELLTADHKSVLAINNSDYLKYTAARYLGWDGKKDEKGRSFLQALGHERVKACPSFWVDTVIRFVKIVEGDYDFVITADCRFAHDIARWEEEGYGVFTVHVERRNFTNNLSAGQRRHLGENALKDYPFAAYIRAGDLEELRGEVRDKVWARLG